MKAARSTPKYTAFRDAIARVTGKTLPAIPAATCELVMYPHRSPRPVCLAVAAICPSPVETDKLLTMEDLDQSYGYILYRTQIAAGSGGELAIEGLHDYAQIYIDQQAHWHALIAVSDSRISTLPAIYGARDAGYSC